MSVQRLSVRSSAGRLIFIGRPSVDWTAGPESRKSYCKSRTRRSTVGRLSVDCRSTVGRLSGDRQEDPELQEVTVSHWIISRSTVGRPIFIGRLSVDCFDDPESDRVPVSYWTFCRSTIGRLSVNFQSTKICQVREEDNYLNATPVDCRSTGLTDRFT